MSLNCKGLCSFLYVCNKTRREQTAFLLLCETWRAWKNQAKLKQLRSSPEWGAEPGNSPPAQPDSASGAQVLAAQGAERHCEGSDGSFLL